MKTKTNTQCCPISGPLLERVVAENKARFAANFPSPTVGETPLPPPALDQDSGGGYNKNFTFPQE